MDTPDSFCGGIAIAMVRRGNNEMIEKLMIVEMEGAVALEQYRD